MNPRSIILDTDPGQDDALAIFLALASPEIELRSIVTVAGNVPQPLVTENALALLEVAGRTDVPVYRGADRPLIREQYTAEYVHGDTGIDGAGLPPPTAQPQELHGVHHLIEACLSAPAKSITLCPVGPLTNIALALATEPAIVDHIREVVWMGGSIAGAPNTQGVGEFNSYVDPHAVHIVLQSGVPLTMFPLDVTHQAILGPDALDRLRRYDTPVTRCCVGMSEFYAHHDEDRFGFEGAVMHDPCVIAYLIDPTLFEGRRMRVAVELADPDLLGRTYASSHGAEVLVMFEADSDRLIDLFVDRWSSL